MTPAASRPTESRTPASTRSQEVVLCSLGGTVQSASREGGGVFPSVDHERLVSSAGAVPTGVRVRPAPMGNLPSAALDLPDLIRVLDRLDPLLDGGARAVVVTMGTDMLEEAAFALDLLWGCNAPLVVTAAMRHPERAGTDGPANLRAAFQVAISPAARGSGCVVVVNEEIHAAWQVQKGHTSLASAFRSAHSGPLGWVAEDRVRFAAAPPDRPLLVGVGPSSVPAVALLRASMGDAPRLVGVLAEQGYSGLVVEAAGGGAVPPNWAEPLGAVAAHMPTVYASRTAGGAALRGTYAGPGSERDLRERGLYPAGMLDGLKARVLLRLLLSAGADRNQIRRCYDAFDRPTHHRPRRPLVGSSPARPGEPW
ncbi:asparaginase [Streptomyces sp. NBC_00626]